MRDGENINLLPKMHKASDKICVVCFLRGRDQVRKILSGEIMGVSSFWLLDDNLQSSEDEIALQLKEGIVREMYEKQK